MDGIGTTAYVASGMNTCTVAQRGSGTFIRARLCGRSQMATNSERARGASSHPNRPGNRSQPGTRFRACRAREMQHAPTRTATRRPTLTGFRRDWVPHGFRVGGHARCPDQWEVIPRGVDVARADAPMGHEVFSQSENREKDLSPGQAGMSATMPDHRTCAARLSACANLRRQSHIAAERGRRRLVIVHENHDAMPRGVQ